MEHGIGILITERLTAAVVSGHEITGELRCDTDDKSETDALRQMPADTIVQRMVDLLKQLDLSKKPSYVGLGMPGIIRNGIVEDSPNLVQFKGLNMQAVMSEALSPVL